MPLATASMFVDASNPSMQVVVSAPEHSALNLGEVVAQGGRIGIYGALVNQRGKLNANSAVVGENGSIFLKASRDTLLEAGSVTSATGTGRGGEISLLGERVGLMGDAQVNASGSAGGGIVLIGGDYQGKNSAVSNAQQTYIAPEAQVKADAMASGDGGKIIAWADNSTQFYGSASARGAGQGNGGLIETSGKRSLDVLGAKIDAYGPGASGQWLLDPGNVTIVAASASNTLTGGAFTASADASILSSEIGTALNGGTDVTVLTDTGSITVSDGVSWSTNKVLTLSAGNGISVGAAMSGANGTLVLDSSAGNISQTAAITVANLNVNAHGGNVSFRNTSQRCRYAVGPVFRGFHFCKRWGLDHRHSQRDGRYHFRFRRH